MHGLFLVGNVTCLRLSRLPEFALRGYVQENSEASMNSHYLAVVRCDPLDVSAVLNARAVIVAPVTK